MYSNNEGSIQTFPIHRFSSKDIETYLQNTYIIVAF
jgi:hypothetical protein